MSKKSQEIEDSWDTNDLDFVRTGDLLPFRVMVAGSSHDNQKDVGCMGGPHTFLPGRCTCMLLVRTLSIRAVDELDALLIAAQWMAGRRKMVIETLLCV